MHPTLCITALATAMFVVSCASKGPSHGYRLVRSSKTVQGSDAGSRHMDFYSGTQPLGTAGQYSISPSGRFALFEDAGRLRLFDRDSGQIREVTDGAFAVPWTFSWDEAAGVVEVTYYQGHDPSRIALLR